MTADRRVPTVRLSDGLIASAEDEVIDVLPGCEADVEHVIAARLQKALDGAPRAVGDLAVGFAVAARRDGQTFADACADARRGRQRLCRTVVAAPCAPVVSSGGGRA